MPQRELIAAVTSLRETVEILNETLKKDYPKRVEIRKDRRFFAVLIFFGIILGMLLSSFITIATVSGCFLSKDAADGHASGICHTMPGFTVAEERNNRTIQRFNELLNTINQNKKMITENQEEIENLKNRIR